MLTYTHLDNNRISIVYPHANYLSGTHATVKQEIAEMIANDLTLNSYTDFGTVKPSSVSIEFVGTGEKENEEVWSYEVATRTTYSVNCVDRDSPYEWMGAGLATRVEVGPQDSGRCRFTVQIDAGDVEEFEDLLNNDDDVLEYEEL